MQTVIILAVAEGLKIVQLVMVVDSALEHLFAGFAFVLALMVGGREGPSISGPGTREGTTGKGIVGSKSTGKGRIGSESPMVLAGTGDMHLHQTSQECATISCTGTFIKYHA
jgi:hypothetical protein